MADPFFTLCARRSARALELAERYPACAEPLRFLSAIALSQRDGSPPELLAVVAESGPELLRRVSSALSPSDCARAVASYVSGEDRTSPVSFFGRVLLQARMGAGESLPSSAPPAVASCPSCGYSAQLGGLVPAGDGTGLELYCSICSSSWPFARERCVSCESADPAALVYYESPELEHLQVRACDTCRVYVNLIRTERARDAVPDIDEVAALPLDVWAREKGYRKLVLNLAGI